MRLSGYHLSFSLTAPFGIALGVLGAVIYTVVAHLAAPDTWGTAAAFNPVIVGVSLIVGGFFGLAHGIVGLIGGLLGAGVASTCPKPWRSKVVPAIAGAAVANVLGWTIAIAASSSYLSTTVGVSGDLGLYALMAAICIPASALVAGLLVAWDERMHGCRARLSP
jgi:hypothetical protein